MAQKKAHVGDGSVEQAFDEATSAATGGVATLVERLIDRTGTHAGVATVFGEPVEKSGRTVIPVARSMWGGGAGSGGDEGSGYGSGGGSGAMSSPVGYIEIADHEARFVPLRQPWQDPRFILAVAFAIWLVSRAVNRILRG